ncbi:MAG: cupin domain-containing protein [Xanthomonadales bacterium]|nr:cupin domain-containing protein [Xanthomonadales bacterium]
MKGLLTAVLAFSAALAHGGEADGLPHAFEAGWHGQKTCELLYETAAVRVGLCTFPPGVGHEKHYHEPHFGYVLEGGTLRIVDADGERTVATTSGGTWSTTERTVHEALNVGDTTTRYLIVEPR